MVSQVFYEASREPRLATTPTIRPRRSLSSPGVCLNRILASAKHGDGDRRWRELHASQPALTATRPPMGRDYGYVVARRNPSRWSLGASALAALAAAGCAAAQGDPRKPSLQTSGEHRLLSLIHDARAQAAAGNAVGVDTTLAQFVTAVHSLRASGQLSANTATVLDRRALATELHAARQLRPKPAPPDPVVNAAHRRPGTTTTARPPAHATPSPAATTPPAPAAITAPAGESRASGGPPYGRATGNPHRHWWHGQPPTGHSDDSDGPAAYGSWSQTNDYGGYGGSGGSWRDGSGSWAGGGNH